jgi:hypothetical protein
MASLVLLWLLDRILPPLNNVPQSIEYDVLIRTQGNTYWDTLKTDTFLVEVIGLQAATTYEWKVRSVCSIIPKFISPFTSIETFTTGSNFAGARTAASSGITLQSYDLSISESSVQISPNPTSGMVNLIPTGFNSINQVRVLNSTGNEVKYLEIISGEGIELNLEALTPGLYFINTITNSGSQTTKLIKQ